MNAPTFEQVRPDITSVLSNAGMETTEYIGETLKPPCACVIPGQPYLEWRPPSREIPFGHFVTRIDVLLVSHREASKKSAKLIEGMIRTAVTALHQDYDIRRVSQPGVVKPNGDVKFIGAVVTIEERVKEPD